MVWVNNDFGKGGRDAILPELEKRGIKVVADVSTEQGQADFASDAIKVKNANADAVFVYLNEKKKVPASCALQSSRASTSRWWAKPPFWARR